MKYMVFILSLLGGLTSCVNQVVVPLTEGFLGDEVPRYGGFELVALNNGECENRLD